MKLVRNFICSAVFILAAASPAAAQRVDPQRVFDLTLQLPDQMMEASIREGQPLKLTIRGTDEFEMVPVMDGPDGRRITLAVYRAVANQPSTRRLVERVALTLGTPATLRSHSGIRVVVDRIRRGPAPTPARQASFTPSRGLATSLFQDENCCVCCGGACACACGVKMSCGSCCMSGCCGGPGEAVGHERFFGSGRACETRFTAAPRRSAPARVATR